MDPSAPKSEQHDRTPTGQSLIFFNGPTLDDPNGLFNSSLNVKVRRAIDIKESDAIDEKALESLVIEAVALNTEQRSA